jgi:hypothetical protein
MVWTVFPGPWRVNGKGITYIRCTNLQLSVILMIIDGYLSFLKWILVTKRDNWNTGRL